MVAGITRFLCCEVRILHATGCPSCTSDVKSLPTVAYTTRLLLNVETHFYFSAASSLPLANLSPFIGESDRVIFKHD